MGASIEGLFTVALIGLSRDRIRAIPHGVGPAFTPDGARRPWRRAYVLYVGALNARKGLDTLLDAFSALPERLRREVLAPTIGSMP